LSETDRPVRSFRPRRLLVAASLAAAALGLLALGLFSFRREIAREAVSAWLSSEGVRGRFEFDALSATHLSGNLVIGPASAPVLVAPKVDADFAPAWTSHGFEMRLSRVRLIRPRLHARLVPSGLSFGELDPLLRKLAAQPAQPQARPPALEVDQGDLTVTTQAGVAEARVDVRAAAGRLQRLDAVLTRPARLQWSGREIALASARVSGRTLPDGDLTVDGEARADFARGFGVEARGGRVSLRGRVRLDGSLQTVVLTAPARLDGEVATLAASDVGVEGTRFRAEVGGGETRRSNGAWSWRLAGALAVQAERARRSQVQASGLALTMRRLRAEGTGLKAKIDALAELSAGAVSAASWRARGLETRAAVLMDAGEGSGQIQGAVSIRDVDQLGAPAADALGPLGRIASGFALDAPRVELDWNPAGTTLRVPAPVRAAGPGAAVSLSPRAGAPLVEVRGKVARGAFDLGATAGSERAEASVAAFRYADGRLKADLAARATGLALGPLSGGRLAFDGVLSASRAGLALTASRCAELGAEKMTFGDSAVTGLSGRLCPRGAPLVQASGGGWRVAGQVEAVQVNAPELQLRADGGAGRVELGATRGEPQARVDLKTARVLDAGGRFQPTLASGTVTLEQGRWRGAIALKAHETTVARLKLDDELASGRGDLRVETGPLAFRRGGLQPQDLTPLAAGLVGSPAEGLFEFAGGFRWTRSAVESSGRASLRGFSFRSPLGAAKDADMTLDLTSLAPLVSRPAQPFAVAQVDSFVPLLGVKGRVQLLPDRIRIEGASAQAAGGTVRLERTEVPFADGAAWSGAIDLSQVRTEDLIRASPFADKIELSARINGRLPFVVSPHGVTFTKGEIAAIGPGRLSIRREALTGGLVAAAGAPPQATPNAMQAMAYQALEDLAFSKLDAEVNSLPGGRLGVLFHVKGRHAPAHPQALALPLADALRGRIADKPLPLPAGTEVDLTLDTSVNFDELVKDFSALQPGRR
jgi:hypothetical protein